MTLTWRTWLIRALLLSLGYIFVTGLHTGAFFTLLSFAPIVAILAASRKMEVAFRPGWWLIAIGQLMFALGDAITYNYTQVTNRPLPYPSMGDIFYQLTYPFAIAGIAWIIWHAKTDRALIRSTFLTFMGVGVAIAAFLMAPLVLNNVTTHPSLVAVTYPIWDFCMLVGFVHLWGIRAHPAPILILIAVASLLAIDTFYAVADFTGANYQPGGRLDFGWLVYYALLGAAALRFADEAPEEVIT